MAELIGPQIEPIKVIRRVEEHRWFWRPTTPRVILLAESHVYTSAQELARTIRAIPAVPHNSPAGFVRLVYCLGYGENAILDSCISSLRHSGTPQFWKVFVSCLNSVNRCDDFAGVQASRTQLSTRIRNKVRLLEALKESGVWLVDASIAALYFPGCAKPAPRTIEQALQASWDLYTGTVVAAAAPQAILCIGFGVARLLHSRLNGLGIPWVRYRSPTRGFHQQHIFKSFAPTTACVPIRAKFTQLGNYRRVSRERELLKERASQFCFLTPRFRASRSAIKFKRTQHSREHGFKPLELIGAAFEFHPVEHILALRENDLLDPADALQRIVIAALCE